MRRLIFKTIDKIAYYFSKDRKYNRCKKQQEINGNVRKNDCKGLSGGDNTTEYLQTDCIDCPYLYLKGENNDNRY